MEVTKRLAAFALLLLIGSAVVRGQRKLGELAAVRAGFSTLYEHVGVDDPRDRYSLLLASFNPIPLTADFLFRFPTVGRYLDDLENAPRETVTDDLLWPREPGVVPLEVFRFEALCQPDGFLVPGKNFGAVQVIDVRDWNSPVVHDLTTGSPGETKNWFYHRAAWKDVDLDGLTDVLINRARINTGTGEQETEMVWFRHPDRADVFDQPWETAVLKRNVSDTMIYAARLRGGLLDYDVMFTVGYFTRMLAVHWSTHPDGAWDNPADVQTRVIDTAGQYFDVEVVDMNKDGRLDLLTTLNAEVNGSVNVYEIPDDFRSGEYIRHKLADGFDSRSGLQGGGSPGQANAFYPTADTSGKPYVILSGDDDGRGYYMTPQSPTDPANWGYDLETIIDEGPGNIVGRLTAFDADGDGNTEVFLPAYNQDKVHVYTFAP